MSDWNEDEPLIDGFAALPPRAFDRPCPPESLRDICWQRTARAVRVRRRRRRVAAMAVVAAAYGMGLGTAWWVAGTQPVGPSGAAEDEVPAKGPEPWDLVERSASAPPAEQERLLTMAGDRYLSERLDVLGALKCYRRVLDMTGRTEVAPKDSWLLAALKRARE